MDIKRSNGDPNIKYYVNDPKLKISELRDKRIIVFGERHNNEDDMALVKKLITELKPSFVLCEALGDYVLGDKLSKDLKYRSPEKMHYYHGFTKRWIKFSQQFDIPFIGIEYTELSKQPKEIRKSFMESFKLREHHFIQMIDKYAKKGKVIAITGDTHLRTIKTDILGDVSPLYTKYNGKKNSAVIRSAEGEIE